METFEEILKGIGAVAATVVLVGAVISAVKTIYKDGWGEFKRRWITPRKSRREMLEKVIARVESIDTKVERVDRELRTNGGSSLKDVVVMIDERTQKIQARIDHQDETNKRPMFHLDAAGKMCFVNAAFRELVDAEEHDLFHQNYLARIVPESRQLLDSEIREAIAKRMPFDVAVGFRVRGSSVIQIRLTGYPNVRSGSNLMGFFGTAELVEAQ